MSLSETRLYDIQLPQFLINFKDACLAYLIPSIDSCITYLENSDSTMLILLIVLLFVQLIRIALIKNSKEAKPAASSSETRQMSKEIKDLKKELKSIQTMLTQLKAINPQVHAGSAVSAVSNEETRRLINSCKESWEQREAIATQILDWQVKIIKEVTKLKNKTRSSRSPSKQATSSKQFSTQSKKSIASAINYNTSSAQPPFQSEVQKPKSSLPESVIKEELSQHEETVIKVEVQSQPATSHPHPPSINIEVHEFKKDKENVIFETYESVSINPHPTPANEQTYTQNIEQPIETQSPSEQKREAPSFPPVRVTLPKPPTSKREAKRMPPPPGRSKMAS